MQYTIEIQKMQENNHKKEFICFSPAPPFPMLVGYPARVGCAFMSANR